MSNISVLSYQDSSRNTTTNSTPSLPDSSSKAVYMKNLIYIIADAVFSAAANRSKHDLSINDIDSKALIEFARKEAAMQTQKEGFN